MKNEEIDDFERFHKTSRIKVNDEFIKIIELIRI